MSTKVFLDTNIVLDIIDSTRSRHQDAVKLWEHLVLNNYEIYISEDMITTIFYIVKNKKYVLEFLQLIYKRWHIVSFGLDILEEATMVALDKDADLEDLLQCLSAKDIGCSSFITNDTKFFDCGIEIVSTKDFLSN